MDYSHLNEAQREAVTTADGRLLILAGAGSGKTSVLTLRIVHLMKSCNVRPEAILGLTFTNKAAEEMRARLALLIDPKSAKKVILSTFHSFCMWVLRREAEHLGYTNSFTLYDRQDLTRLLSSIARDVLEHEGQLPSVQKTLDVIGLAKNKGISPENISGSGSTWHDGFAKEVGKRLNESLRAYNAVDFDHLLWLTGELFERFPAVLEKYQQRFSHVMIDEYQDTNPIQAKIAYLLTQKSNNLCVVGDDDQSIYSWRGADVTNILRFPDAKVVKLEQNFRSTNQILKAANALIDCNKERHRKNLWSNKGDGVPLDVFYAPSEVCEAEAVVSRLIKLKEKHSLRWGDFAILYRSNALARPIESALLRNSFLTEDAEGRKHYRGIPYRVYGGDEFYEHKEVKDLLGYLRVIVNPDDHEGLLRVMNYPRRGIGEQALDLMTQRHRKENLSLWQVMHEELPEISDRAKAGVKQFIELIEWAKVRFKEVDYASAMQELISKLQFQKAIFEEVKSDAMRKWKLENINGLVSSLKEYQERMEEPSLVDYLSSTLLNATQENWKKESHDATDHVHLMTFHSAKGLEFRATFLIGLEDHLIPHEKSLSEGTLEEERRLMYVAITRAKEFLTLSMASSRKRMGIDSKSKPSRFLFEIPPELMKSSKWDSP
ncbi:MAG: pcrA [Chlamydiia bacterium]|nr:pcrA [Chlamydiia bacterium]